MTSLIAQSGLSAHLHIESEMSEVGIWEARDKEAEGVHIGAQYSECGEELSTTKVLDTNFLDGWVCYKQPRRDGHRCVSDIIFAIAA